MRKRIADNLLDRIEAEIRNERFGSEPLSLYAPLRYIMKLGGKRLRPMLTLLSYSLYRDDPKRILPVAVAVETFHNFTLLHDDIMDKAPLRRGKMTVHEKWNTHTAILAGDVMLVKVYERMLAADDSNVREILDAFNHCATAVCEGQQWDMEFETRAGVTEKKYLEMIRLKTAELLGFSLKIGAILAGASGPDQKALYEFGIRMGIGFQLKDDLLDVYGDGRFGKQIGGDIIANKKTFLLIKALKRAKDKQSLDLADWLSRKRFNKSKKVEAVTAIYDGLNIRKITEDKIRDYFSGAFKALDRVSVPENRKAELRSFALRLMERQA